MKKSLFVALAVLLLTSCVTRSPFKEEYYFQAMGTDSEIVMTADVAKLKTMEGSLLGVNDPLLSELIERSNRLSLSLYKDEYSEDDAYPSSLSDLEFYGAAEGDFPSFTVNTALSWSKELHKEKRNGVKFYTNDEGSIEVAVPKSGVLLFASKSYDEAYKKTISDRVIYIPSDTAALLGESVIGLYVRSPKTMIDIGFELPSSVIYQMSDAVIYVVEKDGSYYLNADITMKDENLASTLIKLLRNQIVAELRRAGVRPDYTALAEQYRQSGSVVSIREREMDSESISALTEKITGAAGGLI